MKFENEEREAAKKALGEGASKVAIRAEVTKRWLASSVRQRLLEDMPRSEQLKRKFINANGEVPAFASRKKSKTDTKKVDAAAEGAETGATTTSTSSSSSSNSSSDT